MKFWKLISELQRTGARVFWALNLSDSLFRGHASHPKQNQRVNSINSDQTQTSDDDAQVQSEALRTGVLECWILGPNYTWCQSGRGRN